MTRQILMNKFGSLVSSDLVADAAVHHTEAQNNTGTRRFGKRKVR